MCHHQSEMRTIDEKLHVSWSARLLGARSKSLFRGGARPSRGGASPHPRRGPGRRRQHRQAAGAARGSPQLARRNDVCGGTLTMAAPCQLMLQLRTLRCIAVMLGLERSLGSRIVTYADDLVILCRRGKAEEAVQRLREIMGKLKLTRSTRRRHEPARYRKGTRCGAVAVGQTYPFPPLSSGGALVARP